MFALCVAGFPASADPASEVAAIDLGSSTAASDFAADSTCKNTYDPGKTITIPSSVASIAAPQAVYQSACQGAMTYTIGGLSSGSTYTVVLHFAELYFTTAGSREFNVAINGTAVAALQNFDIVKAAGAGLTAVIETVPNVTATGGQIVISLTNGAADQPMLNGLEVQSAGTSPAASVVTIDAGSSTAQSGYAADTTCPSSAQYDPGKTVTIPSAIASIAAPEAVYQSACQGARTYTVGGLTSGASYNVVLHFAELYFTSPGSRQFNVSINGNAVAALQNFDIVQTAGASATALVETVPNINATGGQIVIALTNGAKDQPMINGIQITSAASSGTCTAAPSAPTGLAATTSSSSSIGLTWTAVTPPTNCGISAYNVYRSTTSGFKPSSSTLLGSTSSTSYSSTGLAAGTTYYYVVEAVDAAGSSTASAQASAKTSTTACSAVPSAPSGFTATTSSSSAIALSWNTVSPPANCSISSYNLYRSTTSGFTPSSSNLVTSASGTTYSNTGLPSGTTYYYVVEAVDADGSSVASTQVSAKTSAACTVVPSAPTGLSASATSSNSIALSWSAVAAPTNCSISSYSVYASTTGGFTPSATNLITTTAGTTYTNSGLTASTTYYYVVEAVDSDGSSAASTQQSAQTQPNSGTTEIVAIAAGGPAISNAAGGDASFVADEYFSGGGTAPSGDAVSTAGVTNAAPTGVYDAERNGTFSYTIPGLAPSASYTVLLQFAETYFTSSGSRVFNVFVNNTTGTPTIANLDIYAQAGANKALVKTVTTTANNQGQIVISFTNGGADQPKIDGIEVRGAASACTLTPSSAPTGLAALQSSPSIIGLNWTGVAPPPNCPISYSVYRSTTSGFTPSTTNLIARGVNGTSYSDTGLTASTTYYYVVEATDSDGTSTPSTQASAQTNSATSCIAVPSMAPSGLNAISSTAAAIEVTWSPITPPNYCTNIRYNVYGSTTSNFTPSLSNQIAKGITSTTFFNTGLAPQSIYYYIVQATDEDGASSAYSAVVNGSTLPPATTLTAATASANEIDLAFPAVSATPPVIYNIFRSTAASFTPSSSNQVGSTKSNFYNDVVLTAATKYYYIVQASGPSGTTTVGAPVSATTLPLAPNTPPFWDASNIPSLGSGDVIVLKFLNRTNGVYSDSQIYWSVDIGGTTTTSSIAQQNTLQMPANASGRVYFYLGAVNQNTNNYWDFLEYTLGTTFINMNATRVDAYGVPYAFLLTCGDGTNIAIGESANVFAEDRASTFQRYINSVPAQFQTLAELQNPYRIVSPSAGGFDTGGQYQDYYNAWIQQLWSANGITIPLAIPNGDGLGNYPDLSAAIYRHVGATAGTFNSNGTLANQGLWGNPSAFYQTAPASYYAEFLHNNAINGQQYAFPYDDAGGYSADVGCQTPKTLIIAIGW